MTRSRCASILHAVCFVSLIHAPSFWHTVLWGCSAYEIISGSLSRFINHQSTHLWRVNSGNLQLLNILFVHFIGCCLVLVLRGNGSSFCVPNPNHLGSKFSHVTPRHFCWRVLLLLFNTFAMPAVTPRTSFSAKVSRRLYEPSDMQKSFCDRFRQWCSTGFWFFVLLFWVLFDCCLNHPSPQIFHFL